MAFNRVRHATRFGVLAAIASAALILTACGGGQADAGPTEGNGDAADLSGVIRVGYLATGSSLPLFATAEKYADEIGINLEMIQVNSGNESLTGVATGQFDVGFAGIGSGAYNAVDEGLPVRYVAPMHAGYLEDYFIISSQHADSPEAAADLAEDMSDFAGQSFAANAPGVVTEALLGFALERVGLSMSEINLEHIPFPDQVVALANGGIAAGILSEPFPTQAEGNGAGYRPWETPDTEPMPFTGIIYNTDWAEANPQLAEAFMEAYALAAADLAENGWDTPEMLDLIEQYTGADPAVVAASRQHHIPADLSVDLDLVLRYQEFFMEQNSLNYDEIIPEEQIWDFRWRDAVLGN
ncbi:ABC transporter substrate-binding protein [Microbacterium sp.]|uniref:ABC transporter substrate-binding protein n=1 Tax=Microbacterium sp. TaxID=51671 RepID=UPI0037C90655